MADKKPTKKLVKTSQKGKIRRAQVEAGVIAGKPVKQIAKDAGVCRQRVTQILSEPEFRQRIAARCEDAASLTENEVIGTLANQMRSDVTELFTDSGAFNLQALREKKLGHLIKKIKVKREVESFGDEKYPVDVIEIEIHNSQSAAIQLSKILGIERLPRINEADIVRWNETAERIAKKHKKTVEEVKRDLIAEKPELATYLIQ